jgi:hypothetical protein
MEIQINNDNRVLLEGLSQLFSSKQIFVQWKDMEQTGTQWQVVGGNAHVAEFTASTYDEFIAKTEAARITAISDFIALKYSQAAPTTEIANALEIPIPPLPDGTTRIVQVYDMKINYAEKWVRLYTRCVYSVNREPKYVVLTADNNTQLPNGQGGYIGEYDYLYYRVNIQKESLIDVQTEIIQLRATPEGGAKWD